MIDPVQAIWIGVALCLGAMTQGAIGFASGMLSIPIMVWAGVPLPQAIVVLLVMVVVQTSWNLWRLREHIRLAETLPMVGFRLASLYAGILSLAWLVSLGQDRVKQAIGLAIGLALVVQWVGRVKPKERLAPAWTPAAGLASGWMAGAVGMGGPPLVLWVMAHDWSTQRARCFLWVNFLAVMPVQIALMCWAFPADSVVALPIGLAYTPAVIGASVLGAWLGSKLSRQRLRAVAYAVLGLIALASIAGPWL